MRKMTIGSLFDGSGGFPLAGSICGIEPIWASEIEPYPIAVTKTRFPKMKHLGDVQKISGAEIDPVDVITFGSPCQDMSIAGKRAGLLHEGNGDDHTTRSGLFYEAIRIIREMRGATNGKYPAFAVWENVPGAFSSNGGADFKTVLEEFASVAQGERVSVPFPEKRRWLNAGEIVGDGFSIAWRVLDAQYWGVPQRRKRIYLVADFAGGRAGKILFKRESGCGNPESCGEAREETSDNVAGGAGGSDRACLSFHLQQDPISSETIAPCLSGQDQASVGVAAFMGGQGSKAGGLGYAEEIAPTIKSVLSGGNTVPDVVYAINDKATLATNNDQYIFQPVPNLILDDQGGQQINVRTDETCPTLRAEAHGNVPSVVYCLQGNGIDRAETAGCNGKGWKEDSSYTLNTIDRPAVAYATDVGFFNSQENVAPTLLARIYKDPHLVTFDGQNRQYIVRRLTPTECARLQGFPDGWGDIPLLEIMSDADAKFWENVRKTYAGAMGKKYRPFKDRDALVKWYNKLHTDSAEYKMWGNGIALPCAVFVMQGIAECVSAME